MSPSQSDCDPDQLFWGYRERTRALLRHLILERGLCPSHPLVTSYDHHLYLTTAHVEYCRGLEQWPAQGTDLVALRTACFRGCDLKFTYCDRTATSLADEDKKMHKDGRES
ncbi:hypothetical protein J6590_056717 [Homalodisca vitripennis]|nr:hypothetical protein J6590_056717 [Homalodisca vitripennis]